MKRERRIGLLCWMMVWGLAASGATAQGVEVGVEFTYESGLWLYADDIIADAPGENSADSVTGLGHGFGVNEGFSFPRVFPGEIGLDITGGFSRFEGERRRTLPSVPVVTNTGSLVIAMMRSDIAYTVEAFRLELLAWHELFDGVRIEAGAWGTYRITGTFTLSELILSPATAVFTGGNVVLSDNGRRRVQAVKAPFTSSPFLWGPAVGVSYDVLTMPSFLGLNKQTTFYAMARLRGNMDALRDEFSWHSLGLAGGVGIRFNFVFNHPADSPAVDTSAPASVTYTPPLRASIDLYSEGPDGRREQTFPVRRQSVTSTQSLPFIPVVYFAEGSDLLPERYALLAPGDRSFTYDSLAGRDLRWLHYQGLNVLGLRLKGSPEEKITVTGITAPGEEKGLGRRRAARVRRYLREVWDVDERRVKIGERSGDKPSVLAENASQAITGPVRTQWQVAGLDAPQLGLRPAMDGGAGLKRWEILVKLGERRIGHYSSDSAEGDGTIDMGMVLEEMDGGSASTELTAELTVTDSAGGIAVSRDRLPVQISPERSGRRRSLYLLLAPERSPEGTPAAGLETIAAGIASGSRVTVRYAVHGPGGSNTAERHAARIARSLSDLLRERGVSGAGPVLVPADPFPMEGLPEEGLFGSVVTVEVEWEE